MKRKAILIGNTHNLQGVKTDLVRTGNFLCSSVGGGGIRTRLRFLKTQAKISFFVGSTVSDENPMTMSSSFSADMAGKRVRPFLN